METATILVLSTAHLPPRKVRRFGFRSAPHAYGWIVFLGAPGERDRTCPAWFRPIVAAARAAGALLIDFDCDAPAASELPTYVEV